MQKRKDPTPQELAIRAQVERCRWQMAERMARQFGWNGRPSKRIIAQQKVSRMLMLVNHQLAQPELYSADYVPKKGKRTKPIKF
jgi:hypothetical protein